MGMGHHVNNRITLPFVPASDNTADEAGDSDDESTKQRTIGHVEQSKLVDILKKFALPFSRRLAGDDESERDERMITMPFKRYNIPRHYENINNNNPYHIAYNNRNYRRGYNTYYNNRYF
jgi:hypothetical protein